MSLAQDPKQREESTHSGIVADSLDNVLRVDGHGVVFNGDSASRHRMSDEFRHWGDEVTQSGAHHIGEFFSIGGCVHDTLCKRVRRW